MPKVGMQQEKRGGEEVANLTDYKPIARSVDKNKNKNNNKNKFMESKQGQMQGKEEQKRRQAEERHVGRCWAEVLPARASERSSRQRGKKKEGGGETESWVRRRGRRCSGAGWGVSVWCGNLQSGGCWNVRCEFGSVV